MTNTKDILQVIQGIKDLDKDNPEDLKEKVFLAIVVLLDVLMFLFIFAQADRFISLVFIHFRALEITPIVFDLFLLTAGILFSLAFLELKDRVWLTRNYTLNLEKKLKEWDIQGNVLIYKNQLHIKQSELGIILRGRLWKDIVAKFDFKIPKTSIGEEQLNRGFGFIYRAHQLGRYYMLKIDRNGYQPHVRNISWENNGPISKPSRDVLQLDQWVGVKIVIEDDYLNASIGSDRLGYPIQSYSVANRGIGNESSLENRPFTKAPFHKSGTLGFRCGHGEEVVIKNLRVGRLK